MFPTNREVALLYDRWSIGTWLVRLGHSVADALSRIVVEGAIFVVAVARSLGGTVGELAHGRSCGPDLCCRVVEERVSKVKRRKESGVRVLIALGKTLAR